MSSLPTIASPLQYLRTERLWPILGSEQIPIKDCLEREETTAGKIRVLIAAVPNSTIRALADVLIDPLEANTKQCYRAGGLWKGCLQKLASYITGILLEFL